MFDWSMKPILEIQSRRWRITVTDDAVLEGLRLYSSR